MLGDCYGAAVVEALSKKELEAMDKEAEINKTRSDEACVAWVESEEIAHIMFDEQSLTRRSSKNFQASLSKLYIVPAKIKLYQLSMLPHN